MNVDIEIYLSQLYKFFKDNPNDLASLVPEYKREVFFDRCRKICIENSEKGDEISLTKKQLLNICVELNQQNYLVEFVHEELKIRGLFQKSPIGFFSLN